MSDYGLQRPQGEPAATPEVKPLAPLEEKTFAYLCIDGCGEVKLVSEFPEGRSEECLTCRDRRLQGFPPISPPDPGKIRNIANGMLRS
jgi:hypothetical protein